MAAPELTVLSGFSGVGMLDVGVAAGLEYLGFRPSTVGYVERDAYAAGALLARMEEQSLEPAPVWPGNIEAARWQSWDGAVDCFVAGFPCQPWSAAGKREGTEDDRWLWPNIVEILRQTKPALCVFENVRGLISGGGLELVLADLAALGFDAEWVLLPAAGVGANHERERIFILAFSPGRGLGILRQSSWAAGQLERGNGELADGDSVNRRADGGQAGQEWHDRRGELEGRDAALADGLRHGCGERRAPHDSHRGNAPGHQPDGRDSHVANCDGDGCRASGGGIGEPRRNTQPGRDEDMGHADGLGREGAEHAHARRAVDGDGRGPMGNAEHGPQGNGEPGVTRGAATCERCRVLGPADAGRVLADTGSTAIRRNGGAESCPQAGHGRRRAQDGDGIECVRDGLAHAEQPGPQGRGHAGPERRRELVARDADGGVLPFFAPGPQDADWPGLVTDHPYIAPAVEPGLCVSADGLALVVDDSRADQLRCGGNGVVALQAAVAVVELVRRALT